MYSVGLIVIAILTFSFYLHKGKRYFLEPTMPLDPYETVSHLSQLKDTISNDTLYEVRAINSLPVYYYRKILTNVCFDGKCRLLRANVYWNVTGRFLGLEFPPGEFLSKTDHEPFSIEEYHRMNLLLADSSSLLEKYSFDEIMVDNPEEADEDVDAMTSATLPAIKDYIIEGAAYTTLKLWHIVHGESKGEIENFTGGNMSDSLAYRILNSPDPYDVIWGLERLKRYENWSKEVKEQLGDKISGNYSLALKILDRIQPDRLDPEFQEVMLESFKSSEYNIQMLIIDKLKEVDKLESSVAIDLIAMMQDIKGGLFVTILELIGQYNWKEEKLYSRLTDLLKLENDYLRGKVVDLLQALKIENTVKE